MGYSNNISGEDWNSAQTNMYAWLPLYNVSGALREANTPAVDTVLADPLAFAKLVQDICVSVLVMISFIFR